MVLQPRVVRLLWYHDVQLPELAVQLLDQRTRFDIYLVENI